LPCLPLGKLPTDYYTLNEVRFIRDSGLGEFKLIDGWFGEPKPGVGVRYPFREIMTRLYGMRELSPLAGRLCKSLAVQIVGKMAETRATGELGKLRNDILHASVVANNRIVVSSFLISNRVLESQVVCIQTDGCKLTVDLPYNANGIGGWINKGSDDTLVISPFKVYTKSTRPSEFALSDIRRLVDEHPLAQKYQKTNQHRITLVQALRNYRDITRTGELIEAPTSLDLMTLDVEQNRIFGKLPQNGRALLSGRFQSEPIILG